MPPPPPPTERFSQLSIESMPPTTRLQSRHLQDSSSDDSDDEVADDSNLDEGHVMFPSKLIYSLEALDEEARDHVLNAIEDPPQLVLQKCQAKDQHIIFEVSEIMEFSIRTGTADSQWSVPSCSCEEESCRHILWLFDQVTRQLRPDQGRPFTLNGHGYADELGDPYSTISEFHIDVLADSMHTQVSNSASPSLDGIPNPRRVQEVREILASLNCTPVDDYRPDIFDNPRKGKRVIKRRDLECTIFRMLLRNNEFFQYFLSSMRADELVNNKFRRLQQRADTVLASLDAYGRDPSKSSISKPNNVEWCGTHLVQIVRQVGSAVQYSKTPLTWECHAAARTLVHILRCVVDRCQDLPPQNLPKEQRNLFFRLVGDKDQDFVVRALNQMPPSAISPLSQDIENIVGRIETLGAPVSYVDKLRGLLQRIRRSGSMSGSKRQAGGQDRLAKRMK